MKKYLLTARANIIGVSNDIGLQALNGYIKATKYTPDKPQLYIIQYLSSGTIKDIEEGRVTVKGYSDDGGIIADNLESRKAMPKTQWSFETHDARDYGTKILKTVIGETRFDFPKSLYAVEDCLRLFLTNKSNALIVDFFAGSGTTLHAVNLMNATDGGNRRCIKVDAETANKCRSYLP